MSDSIKKLIHHEKQEKGSMLCGQHALNAILQGNYFNASDLAEIARELDELETQFRDREEAPTTSANVDDSGFFSVQVMDRALRVWGLTLIRWRSQELADFHDNPDTQQAFVLNLSQHWFTLRRFGKPDGNGHWFNLNSSFNSPERIGKMYLGMVLQQAEAEGYSVFSVRPLPGADSSVPACTADEIASTIDEKGMQSFAEERGDANLRSISKAPASSDLHEFDDNDAEFQRVLEMSLRGNSEVDVDFDMPGRLDFMEGLEPAAHASSSRPYSSLSIPARGASGSISPAESAQERLQASEARSKARLEQFQREQQMAEQEGGFGHARRRADEHEAEELRRAIEESLKDDHNPTALQQEEDDDDDDDDYRPDSDDDPDADESYSPQEQKPNKPTTSLPTRSEPPPLRQVSRVMDDEDAEFQAALKASLEGLPQDYAPSVTPPRRLVHTSQPPPITREPPLGQLLPAKLGDAEDGDAQEGSSGKGKAREESPEIEQVDMDEIRRRRLARFGGS